MRTGGHYDNLGQVSSQPHLLPGQGAATDPALYNTAMAAYAVPGHSGFNASKPTIRMSWNFAAQAMYDSKVRLRYDDLDPAAEYELMVVYMAYLSEHTFPTEKKIQQRKSDLEHNEDRSEDNNE